MRGATKMPLFSILNSQTVNCTRIGNKTLKQAYIAFWNIIFIYKKSPFFEQALVSARG